MTEDGEQRAEDGSQRSVVRDQRSEVGDRRTEIRGQRAWSRGQAGQAEAKGSKKITTETQRTRRKTYHHRDTEDTELNTFFPAGRLRPRKINYPALLEIRVVIYTHRVWSF